MREKQAAEGHCGRGKAKGADVVEETYCLEFVRVRNKLTTEFRKDASNFPTLIFPP